MLLFGFGLIGYFFCFLFDNIFLSLIIFTLYCLFLVIHYNDKTFTHPVLIFTLFYYPYSTWYIFYSLLNLTYDVNVLSLVVQYSYLGIISFASPSILFEFGNKPNKVSKTVFTTAFNSNLIFNIFYWSVAALLLSSIFAISFSGLSSKREIIDANIEIVNLSSYLAIFLTILVSLKKKNDIDKRGKFILLDPIPIITLCIFVLLYLVGGERDYMFRIIFVMIMMYFYCKRTANFFKISLIFSLVVFAMPFTHMFKTFFLLPGSDSLQLSQLGLWGGEFAAASKNLYMVIYYDAIGGYSFLLNDMLRGLVPLSSRLGLESSARWYDKIFRQDVGIDGTSGWGFSLVAEGYVIDRVVGVIVVMCIVSCLLHFLHRKMESSTYWYVFYLMALSTSIYCIRADIANFLSQTFKVSGISIFAIWICTVTFEKIAQSRRKYEK